MGSIPVTSPDERLVYRTVADEDADKAAALKRITNQDFKDWPNEAGFDGLHEERGPLEIPVVGSIPAWAAGNLYRTGPGQLKIEGTPKGTHYISHWFDGLAHTHRFEIVPEGGLDGGENAENANDTRAVRVFYSSRRQSEERMRLIKEQGAAKLFTFAQRSDPCIGLLGKFMSTFKAAAFRRHPRQTTDTENVNVVVMANVPGMKVMIPTPGHEDAAKQTETAASGHRSLPPSLWISTDANVMRRVDPATLEPIGVASQECLHPDLRGALSSAHAQRDPVTGDFFNFNLDLGPTQTYRVFRVSADTGKTDILATIRCSSSSKSDDGSGGSGEYGGGVRPAYIHSFFLTKNYVVLCIPCTHIAQSGLKILWEHNVLDGLEPFSVANKTRWIVIDRRPKNSSEYRGGVVAEFESAAGFFFHSINAYEEDDGNIVCDVIDYATSDIIHTFYYDILLNRNDAAVNFFKDPAHITNINPMLSRYRLRLPDLHAAHSAHSAHSVQPAQRVWSIAGPHAGELPTINAAFATRQHRFVYSVISQGRSTLADGLCKTDTATRSALQWHAPQSHTPGEAVFIARPGAEQEDDGVLLSVVLDGAAGKSYLLCLDARTMKETGHAEVGFAVGFGFHGLHTKA